MALQGTTIQRWVKIFSSSSASVTSSSLIPPATSVLLRKTSSVAPAKRLGDVSEDSPSPDQTYLLEQQAFQLVLAVIYPYSVCGVHDPDESIGLFEIIPPVGSDRLLASHIPNIQLVPCVAGVSDERIAPLRLGYYPWKSIVLMMKPSVGLTVVTSSFMILLTIVVFPALSSPLCPVSSVDDAGGIYESYNIRIRISLSFSRAFRRMESMIA